MRILVVGAGAVGGYFGGRLLEKGEDVTFLVREGRKEQILGSGLQIDSVHGNVDLHPSIITKEEEAEPFDVILLSTKAYHLEAVMEDLSPFASKHTMILPLLNGMAHMEKLDQAFGPTNVLGGLCFIESTLDASGKVVQTSPIQTLVFGERSGERTERIEELEKAFSGTKANFRLSSTIEQEMWHKYLFISTMSGVTSLFRSPIGPIRESEEGLKVMQDVLYNISAIMRKLNAPIKDQVETSILDKMHQMDYRMKSSMQRDMEKGQPVEAEHFYGYLLEAAKSHSIDSPLLSAVHGNLMVYSS